MHNLLVWAGPEYEGETYIACEHDGEYIYFEVSAHNHGLTELHKFIEEHR